MRSGALAFIDCLGFKGIWENVGPETIIKKLQLLKTEAERMKDYTLQTLGLAGKINLTYVFLSDTVVIGANWQNAAPDQEPIVKGAMVNLVTMQVRALIPKFLLEGYPMALRGCIAYGSFEIHDSIILGPAVDYCAEHEKLANGAFVWLTDEANQLREVFEKYELDKMLAAETKASIVDLVRQNATLLQGPAIAEKIVQSLGKEVTPEIDKWIVDKACQIYRERGRLSTVIPNYAMPVKRGAPYRCAIVNPCAVTNVETLRMTYAAYENIMNKPSEEILTKKKNTLEFVNAVAADVKPYLDIISEAEAKVRKA